MFWSYTAGIQVLSFPNPSEGRLWGQPNDLELWILLGLGNPCWQAGTSEQEQEMEPECMMVVLGSFTISLSGSISCSCSLVPSYQQGLPRPSKIPTFGSYQSLPSEGFGNESNICSCTGLVAAVSNRAGRRSHCTVQCGPNLLEHLQYT